MKSRIKAFTKTEINDSENLLHQNLKKKTS